MKTQYCLLPLFAMMWLAMPAFAETAPTLPAIKIVEYDKFSVDQVLDENVGRQIEVTIATGATFRGKLTGIGAQAIHLGELSGKEFFDAVIDRKAIIAVVLRVRDR